MTIVSRFKIRIRLPCKYSRRINVFQDRSELFGPLTFKRDGKVVGVAFRFMDPRWEGEHGGKNWGIVD